MRDPSHLRSLERRFSAAAGRYERVTPVQEEVSQQVMRRIPADAAPACILDIGCGTGRLMGRLRARWPTARLFGLDVAEGMLEVARQRYAADEGMAWLRCDAMQYEGGPFDLIVSSSALQWCSPLEEALQRFHAMLRPGGCLVAGLMTRATLCELRASRDAVVARKRPPGLLPSLEEVARAVQMLGAFAQPVEEQVWTVTYPSARELLRVLHDMGVTGGDVSRGAAPLQRGELDALVRHYEQHYAAPGGGIRATYGVAYVTLR